MTIYFIPPKPTNLHEHAIPVTQLETLEPREFLATVIDLMDEPQDTVVSVTPTQLNTIGKVALDLKFVGAFLAGVESPEMTSSFMYARDALAWPSANVSTFTGMIQAKSKSAYEKEAKRRVKDMTPTEMRDEVKGDLGSVGESHEDTEDNHI